MPETTEIGKAYLNIVPSMDGFASRLSQAVNQQSGNAGDEAGEQFGSGLVSKLQKFLAAAAVGETIKKAFLEGADLEQSLGGVETLFKDSADQIKEYAYDAFKTAGLSANEYMEQATSTSAALIKSLGGDTQRAAELTQVAITDMSDNFNKFGGDVQNLQNAYQGFARDNFTMLDNLKLGYAGNKQGMEQLLADAEKLSGIHYDISSYADMIEAIHVIQQNLDVTGTTAREAEKTFSGSFNAMSAAVKNFGGILTTGGDVGKAIKDVESTSLTFGKNVMRMIGNVKDGLGVTGDIIEIVGTTAAVYIGAIKLDGIITGIMAVNAGLLESESILTALNLNPIAVAIAATAATGVLLKNSIENATDALDVIPDKYYGLSDAQKELVDGASALYSETRAGIQQRKQELSQLEEESDYTQTLVNSIYDLSKAEDADSKTKAQLKALVDELNESYPDLNLELDENTGRLNKSRAAVEALTKAESENEKVVLARKNIGKATADAAKATEKAVEAEKAYKAAQTQRDNIQSKLKAAQEEYSKLLTKSNQSAEDQNRLIELESALIPQLKQELSESANTVGELSAAYLTAKHNAEDLNTEVENYGNVLAEADEKANKAENLQKYLNARQEALKAATEELKEYIIAVGDATYNISSDTYDKIKNISSGYADLVKDQEDVIAGSLDLFSEFSAGTELSFAELDSNLATNQQALIEWREGIEKLEGTGGISEGLINELKSMGVGSLAQVRALVNATPEQLKHYSDAWEYTYELIHDTAEEQLSKTAEASAEQIRELISQPGKAKASLKDAYAVLAMAVPEGYASKLSENTAEISRVTTEMIDRAVIQKINEMGNEAYVAGWNAVTSAKQGMIDSAEQPFELPDFTTNAFSTGSAFSSQNQSSIFNSMSAAAAENARSAPKAAKTEIKIQLPDGRTVAEWLIDDIDELSALKLRMGV